MRHYVMTRYMIVFDPDLADYKKFSGSPEKRRARNEMLIEFADELVIDPEGPTPSGFPTWDHPVAIRVSDGDMDSGQLTVELNKCKDVLVGLHTLETRDNPEEDPVRMFDSELEPAVAPVMDDKGTYYYYRLGVRMCHRGYRLIDKEKNTIKRVKTRKVGADVLSLGVSYRIVVEHEPLPA